MEPTPDPHADPKSDPKADHTLDTTIDDANPSTRGGPPFWIVGVIVFLGVLIGMAILVLTGVITWSGSDTETPVVPTPAQWTAPLEAPTPAVRAIS